MVGLTKSKPNKKKYKPNPYHKSIKNVFVVEGVCSTYTFFTIGKKQLISSSFEQEQVFEILDLETKQVQLREDLSVPKVLEVIQLKTQNRLRGNEQYLLPNMEDSYEEFWDEICEEQENSLDDEKRKMVNIAMISEHFLELEYEKNKELLKNQSVNYDFFWRTHC